MTPPRDPPSAPPPDPLLALSGLWLELWRQAVVWGPGGLAAVAALLDARQLQRRWLTDLSRAADKALRTPAILQLTRHAVAAAAGAPSLPPSRRTQETPHGDSPPGSD